MAQGQVQIVCLVPIEVPLTIGVLRFSRDMNKISAQLKQCELLKFLLLSIRIFKRNVFPCYCCVRVIYCASFARWWQNYSPREAVIPKYRNTENHISDLPVTRNACKRMRINVHIWVDWSIAALTEWVAEKGPEEAGQPSRDNCLPIRFFAQHANGGSRQFSKGESNGNNLRFSVACVQRIVL